MGEAAEQQDGISVDDSTDEQEANPNEIVNEAEEVVENEIVLAGHEEPKGKPDPKDFILDRISRKKDKLADENARLRQELERASQGGATTSVVKPPNPLDFNTDEEYNAAKATYDRQMLSQVVSEQLNKQQGEHRVAAAEQQGEQNLKTYAETAASLGVSDFNETQDKAFDILGDDFARLIAQELPKDAPKLIYWLGKNPRDAERYRDDYIQNAGHTLFKMGKLAGQLTITPKKRSAADPETQIESSSVGELNDDWQAQIDKVLEGSSTQTIGASVRKIREIKAAAKAAGFDISTLRTK